METNNSSSKANDDPNTKRRKIESDASRSSKPESKNPFLSLPPVVLAKIITKLPIAQWPSLEKLDKNFRDATRNAYGQLRSINLDRQLLIKSENENGRSSYSKSVKLVLQKLLTYSPKLTTLSGFTLDVGSRRLNFQIAQLLAQFEHLESISLGDANWYEDERRGIPLESVFEYLIRRRSYLKELRLYNVRRLETDPPNIIDLLVESFGSDFEIRSPFKLEKFSFASFADALIQIRLDTLGTSQFTELRVGKARIEPDQLTNLIQRASNLRLIELSFVSCSTRHDCIGQRLQANKELLVALSCRETLTAIKLDSVNSTNCACMNFVPEFIQMLKDIRLHHHLRKLAMESKLFYNLAANKKDEICAAISAYLSDLQSIKLHTNNVSDGSLCNVVRSLELEEIALMNRVIPFSPDTIKEIAQLPRLKRLAISINNYGGFDVDAYKSFAHKTTLRDLRIKHGGIISAAVWEEWSGGFASNLEVLMVSGIGHENRLSTFLEHAVCLRVLILQGHITDQSLKAIAESCPNLEMLGVKSYSRNISVRCLQEFVNRCPNLRRLGGFDEIDINSLQLEKYRKIVRDLDTEFWNHDFDDVVDLS